MNELVTHQSNFENNSSGPREDDLYPFLSSMKDRQICDCQHRSFRLTTIISRGRKGGQHRN